MNLLKTLPRVRDTILVFCALISTRIGAQTDAAALTGRIADSSGKAVREATVELVDVDRNTKARTRTNDGGLYIFARVRPGHYRIKVSATGYRGVDLQRLTIYTQDDIQQNFTLASGSPADPIILMANGMAAQTTGSMSTLVEHELVSNLPLNGRSFQTLFQLTPGVVITPTSFASQGQFSTNGQRTDTNYIVVDGVSANFGIAAGVNPGQSAGGWIPALSVFGSTNSLVSTDDVQEFAVLTSSYSAEFGRVPGGQISIVTRSGTNRLVGSIFDYLRNDAFDANDWFANNAGLRRAALRQNDFGGVLGGPIAKDRTFFFSSFEGVQLRQPTSRAIEVPSTLARSSAPPAVKPFLDAYPLPDGPQNGGGLAQATFAFSNPSSLKALSLRADHYFRESVGTFARYTYAVSDGQQRGAGSNSTNVVTDTGFSTKTVTAGVDYSISPRSVNNFRINWSQSSADSTKKLDDFGGAIPIAQQLVFPPGFNQRTGLFQFSPAFTQQVPELELGTNVGNSQTQINVLDDVSLQIHGHLVKAGIDFRQLSPRVKAAAYEQQSFFLDISSALANRGLLADLGASVPVRAVFNECSAFVEDSWKWSSRVSGSLGVRWEFAPTPSIRGENGLRPFAVVGFNNLDELSLARQGTPFYRSSFKNFAPRMGFAYEVGDSAKIQSVVKGGVGVYFDLSNGPLGDALDGGAFPFAGAAFVSGASLPLRASVASPPPITTNPPFSTIVAFEPSMRMPYSVHWNLSFEQAIGNAQQVDVSYVGSAGHSLLRTEEYFGGNAGVPASFHQILLTTNAGYSSFSSMQIRFERRTGPARVLAAYSLSHSLDNVSTDVNFLGIPARFVDPHLDYGPSDFDIRHTASVGIDYTLPQAKRMVAPLRFAASGWSLDLIVISRSSPPVDPFVLRDIGFGTYDFRPDLTPGVPSYIFDPSLPGGRSINPKALSVPSIPKQGNVSRNFFRGFPLFQADLALGRSFRMGQYTRVQARIDAFNILNRPNFAPPAAQLGTIGATGNFLLRPGFGVSPAMLNQGLQGGAFGTGFSPLYQIGAPRSIQLSLGVEF